MPQNLLNIATLKGELEPVSVVLNLLPQRIEADKQDLGQIRKKEKRFL